jgi:hypothetical protein
LLIALNPTSSSYLLSVWLIVPFVGSSYVLFGSSYLLSVWLIVCFVGLAHRTFCRFGSSYVVGLAYPCWAWAVFLWCASKLVSSSVPAWWWHCRAFVRLWCKLWTSVPFCRVPCLALPSDHVCVS